MIKKEKFEERKIDKIRNLSVKAEV